MGGGNMKFGMQIGRSPIQIYCVYVASDCIENQRKMLALFYDQFEDLLSNGITYLGVNYEILHFDKGDMKQSEMNVGMGPNGTMPSRYSEVLQSHLRSHKNGTPHTPNDCFTDEPLKIRTIEDSRHNYYLNFKANGGDFAKMRLNQKKYKNIIALPLFPFRSVYQMIIDILHAKLELIKQGIAKMITCICKAQFYAEDKLKERDRLENLLKNKRFIIENKKKAQVELVEDILYRQNKVDRMILVEAKNYVGLRVLASRGTTLKTIPKKLFEPPHFFCQLCLLTRFDDLSWGSCDKCYKSFHIYCLSKTDDDLARETANSDILCTSCKPVEWNLDQHKLEILNKKNKQLKADTDLLLLNDEVNKIDGLYSQYKCPQELEFEEILRSIGADRQNFHGGQFVGKHCDLILKNFDQLIPLLPTQSDQQLFTDYFTCCKNIIQPCENTGFYTDDYIEEIIKNLFWLGRIFPQVAHTILPKVDDLVFHLPKFLRKWKTIGFFNSEDSEKLHQDWKIIERDLAAIRDGPTKLKLIMKRHYLCKLNELNHPDFTLEKKRIFKVNRT